MPHTVLSIVSTLARRGPMNVLMSLIRHLDPLQYRAVIATLSPEPADSLIDEFRSLGVPVRQMKLSRAGAFLSGARGLRRLVSDVQPDLIHTHGLRADVLAAKAGLECPIVSTLHCDLPEDYGFAYGRRLGALVAIRHFAALKRFNHVIAVSESVADTALRWGIATDSIPNGVDLGEYCPPRDLNQMRALRAHFGWPSEAVIVLHTGSLSRRKNPVDVVSGFSASELSRRGMLVFAGGGPLRAECEQAAGAATNIAFLGKRKNIRELLQAADILISASSSEGLPMALLEGCASGIRVLATDIPPHRRIQQSFPDQVQIFGDGNPDAVCAALDSIPNERRQQRFFPAPSALETISGRRMSSQYQELYSSILQSTSYAISSPGKMVPCQ
ncbi:MAG: glycosyltransferase family 4 protein [Terracidiphilus sp.]